MSIVVSNEEIGSCQRRVTVAIPAPAVEAETQRVIQHFRKRVSLPGFRKGKTPVEIVRKRFKEEIEQELLDRLLPRYWKQAEAETALQPLLAPQVDDVEVRPGEDLTFVATVDIRPEVELGELGEFDLPEPVTEPTTEEVDESIEELRRAVADWRDADRTAARGDLVVALLTQLGPVSDDSEATPMTFEVGDERVWEELTVAATGMAAGQKAEFERLSSENGETVTKKYSIEVEKVRERDPAPLDDAFAARVGEFKTVDELREGVRSRLQHSKMRERRVQRETAFLDQMCERYPIDLPKRVVDKEIEQMLSDYAAALARQGVDLDRAEVDWQRLAEETRSRAEKRVRARLLVDTLADSLNVNVEEKEFEAALANMARSQRTSSGALRRELDRAGRLGELRDQLRREKTLETMLGEDSDGNRTENETGWPASGEEVEREET